MLADHSSTVNDVCEELGISRSTLYEYIGPGGTGPASIGSGKEQKNKLGGWFPVSFCTECGRQQPTNAAKFCFECGTPLATGGSVSMQQNESPAPAQETILWEGAPKISLTLSTETRLASARYKLTNRVLYLEEGLFTTTSQRIPLWAVRDANVRQDVQQKMHNVFSWWKEQEESEDVGDIIVHVEHPDYSGEPTVTLRNLGQYTEVAHMINEASRTERLAYERRQRTHYFGQEL